MKVDLNYNTISYHLRVVFREILVVQAVGDQLQKSLDHSTSRHAMATSSGGMLLGHDLSTVLQCEKHEVKYYDFNSSESKPPELIVAAHGANLVRLRVWVNPPAGFSDYASTLEMAKRAKKANLKVLLCLHLSDYWADPGKQLTPGAWANQDFKSLSKTVENYVRFMIESLQNQDTPPFIVAVGNEVSNGMLWPTGALSNSSQFASLLKSGLAVVQNKGIATMVHINNGQDKGLVTWFMDLMLTNQVSFDYLGLSFYPGDGALLSDLKTTLATVAARYNKPMVIAEVSANWTPSPNGPDTQQDALRELLKVVNQVPKGLGAGVCYWESAWLAPGEAYPGEGNHYWNRALWNEHGQPLPALRCFESYAKSAVQPVMVGRHHVWGHNKHDEL